jgi:anti-anti-sigma regulatory factor
MKTADLVPDDAPLPLVDSAAAHPPALLNLTEPTPQDGLMLLDVEGDLDAPTVSRWSELVSLAITDGATGITVDLRGCGTIELGCLSVLVAASGKLKGRGDSGINLVTTPGSPLERRVGATAAKGLPAYSSAGEALRSFRNAP